MQVHLSRVFFSYSVEREGNKSARGQVARKIPEKIALRNLKIGLLVLIKRHLKKHLFMIAWSSERVKMVFYTIVLPVWQNYRSCVYSYISLQF